MEWKKLSGKQKTGKFAADPQTGEVYELETEAAWDILAAIVYALTRAGIAVAGGDFAAGNDSTAQAFSAFAIGALPGYGSQKVFKWLDEHVNRWFGIKE